MASSGRRRSATFRNESVQVEHCPSLAGSALRRQFVIVLVKRAEGVEADHPNSAIGSRSSKSSGRGRPALMVSIMVSATASLTAKRT